ncbi:hypothetical protein [Cyanobium sp. Morenito 9A2]|uniref:hypothetical protein n=1 Tax=Cyanobium sp. Morenito 9A2 TaxID=2823718 RepID=UPI0020CD33AF|nr:hypothetical protein [Cyanobium sp. Morenito 9A2]MCP9849970.1 hypothetical protein [Cyanobium sp. Morenito 9A2]
MVLSRSNFRPPAPAANRAERPALRLILAVAALVSFSLAGVTIQDGPHPLALLASLLPLQLAALLWALRR